MRDRTGRKIDYLRVSVTDRCNMRCLYCMPESGVPCIPHGDILTLEEIAAELGMDVPTAAKHVSMMEIKGKIAKAEGGRYIFKE